MNRLDRFEELVARARREPAPTPDVSAAVRRRLAALDTPPALAPLWVAGACATAAVVLGYLGFQAWATLAEPGLGAALSVSAWWLL